MATKALKRVVLPLIVFPAMTALAFQILFGRVKHGIGQGLQAQCSGPDAPYALPYTGIPKIDAQLCPLVSLFQHILNDKTGHEFLYYGLGSGAIFFCLPYLEAARSKRSFPLALPVVWLLLCQLFTVGIISTIYAPIFILSGSHLTPRRKADAKITRAHAESLAFGLFIGYFVPTFGMLIFKDNQVIAIWQGFPILFTIASAFHRLIRPPSKFGGSGWTAVQIILLGIFMVSSSFHFATIFPHLNDTDALKALFVPSYDVLPSSTPLGLLGLDFLKWDVILGYTSLSLLTLWFANNATQFIGLVLWYAFAIPMAGPGAALTGAILWREAKLQQ